MSSIMCSDAARVGPRTTKVDNRVKVKVQNQLHTSITPPHSRFKDPSSAETGLQNEINRDTETRGNQAEASSIINRQSNLLSFTDGRFSYNENTANNRRPRVQTTRNSPFPTYAQHRGQRFEKHQSRLFDNFLSQDVTQHGNSYYRYPAIIRKSHPSPSQDLQPLLRNDSPKQNDAKTFWQTSSVPASGGNYNGYKETNGLSVDRPGTISSVIQSSKFKTSPSISESLDTSDIKSGVIREKQFSSGVDFSKTSSRETPRLKKPQTLFTEHEATDSHTKDVKGVFPKKTPHEEMIPDAQVYGRTSIFKPFQNKIEAKTKIHQAKIIYHNANTVQYGAQTGTDSTKESVVPRPRGHFTEDSSVNSGEALKRGFKSPEVRYGFGTETFKTARKPQFLISKYSFGQTATTQRTPADFSSPPPVTSDIAQTVTSPKSLVPETESSTDHHPDRGRLRIYQKIGTPPLEGAKLSGVQHGFILRNTQIWQPKSARLHRWQNQTEQRSSNVSTMNQNEPNKVQNVHLKSAESVESAARFTRDRYRMNRKIYTQLVQRKTENAAEKTVRKHQQQSPSTASASPQIPPADLNVESGPEVKSESLTSTKPVTARSRLFSGPTSSSVRGQRVKSIQGKTVPQSTRNAAIVRLPRPRAGLKAATHAEILGSALFVGVRATSPEPATPADEDYSPSPAATSEQREVKGQRTLNSEEPEARVDDQVEDFSRAGENPSDVDPEEAESDKKTTGLFPDNEGSGSGFFEGFVFSDDAAKNLKINEDSLNKQLSESVSY
ncbi:uncharacterized protein V6R79_010709 [Siganus canaliculatus]